MVCDFQWGLHWLYAIQPCEQFHFIWSNLLAEPKGPYFTRKYMAVINQIRIWILHCKNIYIMTHYKSCLLTFFIFIWSGIKEEPKQQNNNRTNLKHHQKNPWNKLFNILYCFAPFTSLTNCAMAFLLSKPTLKHTFLNSSLCTLAFSYPCCALCKNSFATNHIAVSYSCTETVASMWQHPLHNQILFLSVFLILFQIFSSFVNITFGFLCLLHCYRLFFLFFQFFLFFLPHSIMVLLLLLFSC